MQLQGNSAHGPCHSRRRVLPPTKLPLGANLRQLSGCKYAAWLCRAKGHRAPSRIVFPIPHRFCAIDVAGSGSDLRMSTNRCLQLRRRRSASYASEQASEIEREIVRDMSLLTKYGPTTIVANGVEPATFSNQAQFATNKPCRR